MFTGAIALTCSDCGKSFVGRKPSEDARIQCPECFKKTEIPVSEEPLGTEFVNGGRGEDE